LTLHGIPKPVYRAFELLHHLGEERLPVEGQHDTVDAWAVRRPASLTVLLTNHALPRQPIAAQRVRVEVADAPPPRSARVERIDGNHANAREAWLALGQPEYLDAAQVEQLQEASRLTAEAQSWMCEDQTLCFEIEMPAHAVAAVTLEFPRAGKVL
jgi:xylan 1,4-beta-xylosidase